MIDIRAIKVPEGVKFFNKDGNPIDGVAFTLSYKPGTINPKGFPDEAIDYIILNRTLIAQYRDWETYPAESSVTEPNSICPFFHNC